MSKKNIKKIIIGVVVLIVIIIVFHLIKNGFGMIGNHFGIS